jgi:hypothetical protein
MTAPKDYKSPALRRASASPRPSSAAQGDEEGRRFWVLDRSMGKLLQNLALQKRKFTFSFFLLT